MREETTGGKKREKKGNLKGLKEGKNGPLERQGEKRKNQVEGKKREGGRVSSRKRMDTRKKYKKENKGKIELENRITNKQMQVKGVK